MLMTATCLVTDKPGLPHQKCHHPESPRAHHDQLPGSSEESLQPDGEQLLPQVYPLRPLQRAVCQRQEASSISPSQTRHWSHLFTAATALIDG